MLVSMVMEADKRKLANVQQETSRYIRELRTANVLNKMHFANYVGVVSFGFAFKIKQLRVRSTKARFVVLVVAVAAVLFSFFVTRGG